MITLGQVSHPCTQTLELPEGLPTRNQLAKLRWHLTETKNSSNLTWASALTWAEGVQRDKHLPCASGAERTFTT